MKKLSYTLLIAILFVGLTGCGDDSTGPGTDPGQAPAIPDISQMAKPDISFFEENNPQGQKGKVILAGEYSNFSTARFKAIFGTFFASFGQVYMGFLNPAYNESAEFKDGLWEWSYSYSSEGQSGSMRFTAQEQGSSINWKMYMSFDDGQGGGYDNYKVMEGTTNKDGSEGQWTFNALDEDNSTTEAVATTEWNTTSDTERTITTKIYDEGNLSTTFDYEQNGVEHTMIFTDGESSDEDEVFWNTDTKMGYVIDANEGKLCWDANLMNTPCS